MNEPGIAMKIRLLSGLLACGLLWPAICAAQDKYPTKPIRLVVPFAVGGATDVIGRLIAAKMSEFLGQQVVVDNRAGAGGNIGTDLVAKAAPDGYTLLVGTGSTHTMNPRLYKKIGYDAVTDFTPIGQIVVTPFLLVANKDVPATDLKSLLATFRANPGKHNYGSSGVGSNLHLCTEWFKKLGGGLDVAHVPYRGAGPMMNDLLGGQVSIALDTIATSTAHMQAGSLRPIGSAMLYRLRALPDLPTLDEQGMKGFECYTWNAIFAPAKTPARIVETVHAALVKTLRDPATAKRLEDMGFDPTPDTTPAKLEAFVKAELDKWTPIIKDTGVQLD